MRNLQINAEGTMETSKFEEVVKDGQIIERLRRFDERNNLFFIEYNHFRFVDGKVTQCLTPESHYLAQYGGEVLRESYLCESVLASVAGNG